MKSKVFILCFTILMIFGQIVFGQEKGVGNQTVSKLPATEKRWALIIGVSRYEDDNITPLPGAANDARALRDALRDYAGFDEKQIILLTTDESKDRQPTKNNILRYLGNLSGTVPKDGLLLVAFSGHGIERQKQAFLLASDTPYNDNVKVLERTALSVSEDFKELIRDTGVGQVIILLDACRNDPSNGRSSSDNPLTQAYKDGFNFDIRNREVEAFATLYATSIGERAYEYTRENKGYFTWAFIEGLKGGAANANGEITLGALIRYVEKYVPQQVKIDLGNNKNQKPFSVVEGYKAEELVLGIANSSRNTSLSSIQIAWNNFRGLAKTFLKYDLVSDFSDGLVGVGVSQNKKCGFIDKSGKIIIPFKYDTCSNFSEGLVLVKLNEKWGYVDKFGREVVSPKYEEGFDFNNGLAGVKLNGKWGKIDKSGKVIISIKYDEVRCYTEDLIGVELNGKFGFVDRNEKIVIPFKFYGGTCFSEGVAAVKTSDAELGDKDWGFIDKTGKAIISPQYDVARRFNEGLAPVGRIVADFEDEAEYSFGLINKNNRLITDYKYNFIDDFSEGMAVVWYHGKQGFINTSGEEVISLKYDSCECGSFSEGIAQVALNNKFGFIDKTGREVIPIKYDDVWCYAFREEGFIGVTLNGKKGFVDIYGNEYFDF